jgi:hypothetical protein
MTPTPQTEPSPDQIEKLIKEPIAKLIREKIDAEVAHEKQRQYRRLRKAHEYYNGRTYLVPDITAGYLDWTYVQRPGNTQDNAEAFGLYDYHIDIIKSYGRKYFGVLGVRPFHNVKGMPDDSQSETDRKAALQAELGAQWCKAKWNIRILNIVLFYLQWKAGTVYVYTPFVADKDVFGETEEPQYIEQMVEVEPGGYRCPQCGSKSSELAAGETVDADYNIAPQSMCAQCGAPLSELNFEEPVSVKVPQEIEPKKYPGSGPLCLLETGYTVTIPFDAKNIEKAGYVVYEKEDDRALLLSLYGKTLRDLLDEKGEIKPTDETGMRTAGVHARAESASIDGTTFYGRQTRWSHTRTWLQPFFYEYVEDQNLRETLYAQYPDGLKVSSVEGHPVKFENEASADVWSQFEPEPGDFAYHDPMCWGILGHQDVVNDVINIEVARQERGLPTAIADPDVINIEAINNRPYLPQEIIEAKPGAGGRLDDAIKILPTPQGESKSGDLLSMMDNNVQQHSGLLPSVWGGGERQPTAKAEQIRLNQGMMQLSVQGEYAMLGWNTVLTKAVKLIGKYAPKNLVVKTQGRGASSEVVDVEALKAGHWHFESDVGIPMSWAEKQQAIDGIIRENPQVAHALGLDMPSGVEVVKDFLLPNTPELQIPGDDIWQYTLDVIEQLLQGEAIENGPELLPSIPPQDFVEDPAAMAENARLWLISDTGRKAAKENPAGWRNVVAWGLAQQMKAQPPMPVGPDGQPLPMPQDGGAPQQPPQQQPVQ